MYEEQSQRPPEPFVFSVFGNQGNVNLSPPHLVEGVKKTNHFIVHFANFRKKVDKKETFLY